MEKEEIEAKLLEVRAAIKTLCFLYPRAAGFNQPRSAGVVLRRFQQREQDLIDIMAIKQ